MADVLTRSGLVVKIRLVDRRYAAVSLDRVGYDRPDADLRIIQAVLLAAADRCWLRGRRGARHRRGLDQGWWCASPCWRADAPDVAAALAAADGLDYGPATAYVRRVIDEARAVPGRTVRERWLRDHADELAELIWAD